MRDYSSQKNEIETIKPRTITVNLSDADVKRLAEKSGEGGLTISELLENFIGDLVDGTYSNGRITVYQYSWISAWTIYYHFKVIISEMIDNPVLRSGTLS